jgi:hypothetical protein
LRRGEVIVNGVDCEHQSLQKRGGRPFAGEDRQSGGNANFAVN